jgi:hypothetical protein
MDKKYTNAALGNKLSNTAWLNYPVFTGRRFPIIEKPLLTSVKMQLAFILL